MEPEVYQWLFSGQRRSSGSMFEAANHVHETEELPPVVRNILVVCLANICRSPMAQGLLAQALRTSGLDHIQTQSAGLRALTGHPADVTAREMLRKWDIDLSSHRASQLSRELTHWADLVLVMDNEQKKHVHFVDPAARGKVFRLGEWSDFDVPDPHGRSVGMFETSISMINKGVSDWVERLKGHGKK